MIRRFVLVFVCGVLALTGAAGLAGARMQVHPEALPLDLLDPAFAVPSLTSRSPPGSTQRT